jgi:hypothetical protein
MEAARPDSRGLAEGAISAAAAEVCSRLQGQDVQTAQQLAWGPSRSPGSRNPWRRPRRRAGRLAYDHSRPGCRAGGAQRPLT